ncbi:MAG: S-adenosylmethionine synthetase [Lachnospiraceae bacterium]|nr:S-adenosylmethionine synthetase [Lachnospiraceae bacterium]
MIEKVNMYHPDKLCDRVGGAIVDWVISQDENARVAVEVMCGHGLCTIMVESNVEVIRPVSKSIVERIIGDDIKIKLISVPQDTHLADNQKDEVRCGDNGIFKGVPLSREEIELTSIAHEICEKYPTDGKYILDEKTNTLIVCQSCCDSDELKKELERKYPQYNIIVNPLGDWTGGVSVDTGCTNRKIGSDLYKSVTGGGIQGKDASKADVSVNIFAWLQAQKFGKTHEYFCAIGDTEINGIPYSEIVRVAKEYINTIGGYEALAEWGLY